MAPPSSHPADARFDRSRLIVGVMGLLWVILAVRLVQMQWLDREFFAARANRQQTVNDVIPARPGEILDRQGRLLATTVTSSSLFVDPSRIDDPCEIATLIGSALQIDPADIERQVAAHADKRFCWIKRRLSRDEVEAIRRLELPGGTWGLRDEYLRRYPQGKLAAHVLGLRDIDGNGRGGLEQEFDAVLRGRDGHRALVRDARGRVIEVQDDSSQPPEHGRTLVLSLDIVIQLYAERELDELMTGRKPKSACAVVMDPQTGELLASASRPAFDPNHPERAKAEDWKNTVLSAMYEPGSTFKPFVVASALQSGVVQVDETIDCEQGAYRMGKRVLHDLHPYGTLGIADILVKSSNIGMAKIGERLTNAGLYEAAVAFGFGSKTGIELPGELPGVLRPLSKWTDYSTGSIPMGHELAVTPLQLITAHSALANGGRLIAPRLVLDEIEFSAPLPAESSTQSRAAVVSQTVSADVASWLVTGPMTEVIERGTGKAGQLEGYTVFGKTGTAQKTDPETGEISDTLHVSSFICGAPAADPRVLVLVMVDEPTAGGSQYGGSVAAPSAAAILKKTLVHLRVPKQGEAVRSAELPGADL